jgi:hypothetical protein
VLCDLPKDFFNLLINNMAFRQKKKSSLWSRAIGRLVFPLVWLAYVALRLGLEIGINTLNQVKNSIHIMHGQINTAFPGQICVSPSVIWENNKNLW